ncbi:MAG: hypothetical protein Q9217_005698 [Psora testacea]
MKTKKHREVVQQSVNQDLGLVPQEAPSMAEPSSSLTMACPNVAGTASWSAPPIDQAPVFSRDPGVIGIQIDGTSYNSTALDQAPRFFQDPSEVPTQLDPAWLSMTSREQAPTYDQTYGGAMAQLQREDQPTIALAQAPIFSQVSAGAAGQSSPASYQHSFALGEGTGQTEILSRDHGGVATNHNCINSLSVAPEHNPTCFPDLGVIPTQQNGICYSTATSVQAPVFSQDPGGVSSHVHRQAYFSGGTDQVSTSYQDSGGAVEQFNAIGYLEAPSGSIVSSNHLHTASDQFDHAGYIAAGAGQASTFLQNPVGVSS